MRPGDAVKKLRMTHPGVVGTSEEVQNRVLVIPSRKAQTLEGGRQYTITTVGMDV